MKMTLFLLTMTWKRSEERGIWTMITIMMLIQMSMRFIFCRLRRCYDVLTKVEINRQAFNVVVHIDREVGLQKGESRCFTFTAHKIQKYPTFYTLQ